jgi:hypothetical protein
MTVSLEDQIKCVRRELAMRQRVYAQWVTNGRMKQEAADKELAAMQAVHDTLCAASDGGFGDKTWRPGRRDLDAMREDAAKYAKADIPFMVRASVAPAVIYLAWPNAQHDPHDHESAPFRCIHLEIPLPEGWKAPD